MGDYTPHTPRIEYLLALALPGATRGKVYSYPSQQHIRRTVARAYRLRRSKATLNRHLRGLVRDGWITRTRRHRRDPVHGWMFQSTLYRWRRKTIRLLKQIDDHLRGIRLRLGRLVITSPYLKNERSSGTDTDNHDPGAPLRGPPGVNEVRADGTRGLSTTAEQWLRRLRDAARGRRTP